MMRDCAAVPDEAYAQLNQLNGATLFHRREWHQVLEEAFGWRVRALIDADATGRCSFFLPYVRKRRMGRRVSVCLPLSSRIGPAWREPSSVRVEDVGSLAPLEIHEEVAGTGLAPRGPSCRDRAPVRRSILRFETWFRKLGDPRAQGQKSAARAGIRVTARRQHETGLSVLFETPSGGDPAPSRGAHLPVRLLSGCAERYLAEAGLASLVSGRDAKRCPVAGVVLFYDGATAHYAYGASRDDR